MFNFRLQRLYLCTPDRADLASFIDACISGGVDIVQLREKNLDDRTIVERARLARKVCAEHGVPFILNDRVDLAVEAGADGAHVGQDDMAPHQARKVLGTQRLLGLSTHQPSELLASKSEPLDYISAGPVTETPTKPGRAGTGPRYISFAAAHSKFPFFVTGGVCPDSVPPLVQHGARRFVVVRWLTEASDPLDSARTLRTAIDRAIERVGDPARYS